jgi:transposase
MAPWLAHELRALGLEIICLDADHARAAFKMHLNRTDQNDAEGLAQRLKMNMRGGFGGGKSSGWSRRI